MRNYTLYKGAVQWEVANNILEKIRGYKENSLAVLCLWVTLWTRCWFVLLWKVLAILVYCGNVAHGLVFLGEMNRCLHHWDWLCRELLSCESPVVFWGKEAIDSFDILHIFCITWAFKSKWLKIQGFIFNRHCTEGMV